MPEALYFKSVLIVIATGVYVVNLNAMEFSANASTSIVYSDNIDLDENGESDVVSTLSAGALLNIERAKSNLYLKYDIYRTTHFNKAENNEIFNELTLKANKNSFQQKVNFDVNASVRNVASSIADEVNADIINNNTIEIRQVNTQLSYQNDKKEKLNIATAFNANLASSEDNIGNFNQLGGEITLKNGENTSNLTWLTHYSYNKTFYSHSDVDVSAYDVEQRLGYDLSDNLNASVKFYYDQVEQSNSNSNNDFFSWGPLFRYSLKNDSYLELGYQFSPDEDNFLDGAFVFNPTTRTRFAFDFTRRFYGNSYFFSFSHRIKKLTNTIEYSEEITNFNREFFVDGEVVNSYQISKGLTYNTNFSSKKLSLDLGLNALERTPLVQDNLEYMKIYNGNLNIRYQLTRLSYVTNSFDFNKNTFNYRNTDDDKNLYRRYGLTYNRKISRKLTGDVKLSHINTSNYKENKISVNFQLSLN